jgi:hypothetical protein
MEIAYKGCRTIFDRQGDLLQPETARIRVRHDVDYY